MVGVPPKNEHPELGAKVLINLGDPLKEHSGRNHKKTGLVWLRLSGVLVALNLALDAVIHQRQRSERLSQTARVHEDAPMKGSWRINQTIAEGCQGWGTVVVPLASFAGFSVGFPSTRGIPA